MCRSVFADLPPHISASMYEPKMQVHKSCYTTPCLVRKQMLRVKERKEPKLLEISVEQVYPFANLASICSLDLLCMMCCLFSPSSCFFAKYKVSVTQTQTLDVTLEI